MKDKRTINPELIHFVKGLPCALCGRPRGGQAHHITTVGAGGGDTFNNLLPCCLTHHMMIHQEGYAKTMKKFPRLKEWLEDNGRDDILAKAER